MEVTSYEQPKRDPAQSAAVIVEQLNPEERQSAAKKLKRWALTHEKQLKTCAAATDMVIGTVSAGVGIRGAYQAIQLGKHLGSVLSDNRSEMKKSGGMNKSKAQSIILGGMSAVFLGLRPITRIVDAILLRSSYAA